MTRNASHILHRRIEDDQESQLQVQLATICAKIAEEVYDARQRSGMTQAALATLIGTSQSAIARVEDADYDGHSIKTIAKIAVALELDVAVKFRDNDYQPIDFDVTAGDLEVPRTSLASSEESFVIIESSTYGEKEIQQKIQAV
ncbi:MAG: helix-turn-helix transcriptional regulator [Phycisphaerae bacterium]